MNNLKKRVMSRIYLRYAKNIFLEYPDFFMFCLFVVTSFTLVSVRSVLINIGKMPITVLHYDFNFFVVALLNTSWIIQLLIIGFFIRTIAAGIRLAYKNLSSKLALSKLPKFRY
jgi:hypothetical protein